jgi:hypothetical protein
VCYVATMATMTRVHCRNGMNDYSEALMWGMFYL